MATILLIDDNEMNLDMLGRRLRRKGFQVLEAAGGLEGISLVRDTSPDLVLMDLSMPDLNGLEATRRLKADRQTAPVPIIALTGHALPGDRDKAMAAGCDEFETKPIDLQQLLSKINRLLTPAV